MYVMDLILVFGGSLVTCAFGCRILERVGQERIAGILSTVVDLSILVFIGKLVMSKSHDIINMFGGMPL